MVKRKSRGQKNRNNYTKIIILKYLADKDAEGSVRYYLKKHHNINESRGVRKHQSDLQRKFGFLDETGKLKEDFETYRKILDYLTENKNCFDWNISDFTHNTKYGLEHLNNNLIDWWADKMYCKYCDEYKITKIKITTKQKLLLVVTGINSEQLLHAVRMSPRLFTYMIHIDDDKFHSSNSVRDSIIHSVLYDISTHSSFIDPILFNAYVDLPKYTKMKKYHNGLELELKYQIFPKQAVKVANS